MGATGSALVTIPVSWQRPTLAHSPFSIPAPMLPFREIQGPDGLRPCGLYDVRHRNWVERTGSTACWLAFEPPKSLLPLDIKSATITFKVLGPMERLELSAAIDGRLQSIKIWNTPVGTLTHEIIDSRLLKLDVHGRLPLRIDVGPKSLQSIVVTDVSPQNSREKFVPQTGDPVSYWQFEDLSLELSAEIPGPEEIPAHKSTPDK
jgi:hypothetical protein